MSDLFIGYEYAFQARNKDHKIIVEGLIENNTQHANMVLDELQKRESTDVIYLFSNKLDYLKYRGNPNYQHQAFAR